MTEDTKLPTEDTKTNTNSKLPKFEELGLSPRVLKAIEVAQAITGADKVNTLGFCIGGVLPARAPAGVAPRGERPAAHRTLTTTLLDVTERRSLEESTQCLAAHARGAGTEPTCPVCRQSLPEPLRQRLLDENAARAAAFAEQTTALQAERGAEQALPPGGARGLRRA